MISTAEIVRIPHTTDLTEAGLLQAKRALGRLRMADGRSMYDSFLRAVAATAADLAFRRHLTSLGIGFRVKPSLPFQEPAEHAVIVRDRAWMLTTYLISRARQAALLEGEPELALHALAMVPADRMIDEGLRADDIFIFGLVVVNAPRRQGVGGDKRMENREHWLHILPLSWRRPHNWGPMGTLVLHADSAYELEIGGENASGRFTEIEVRLTPGEHKELRHDFNALSYIRARTRPVADLSLRLPARDRLHEIIRRDWQDLWIEEWSILILGWMPVEQYRARARIIPVGARVFQFDRTRTTNLGLEMSRLRPMSRLFEIQPENDRP